MAPEITDAVPLGERPPQNAIPAGWYALSPRVGGRVWVDETWMDRYPVTVHRYARFVEAGGYAQPEWWSDEGRQWRIDNDIDEPRFWDDPNWPLWRRFLRPTRPVVGVSWYEACAFCRFEGRRLPTEREWEAAARGPDGRLYPWGDEWGDPPPVAVRGVGPRCTWPVGYFPASRGPFGHHDLIGNVWQWTADDFEPRDPRGAKAVRGGSWASRPEQNRNDHWNGYLRGGRHSHVGFRTVGAQATARSDSSPAL